MDRSTAPKVVSGRICQLEEALAEYAARYGLMPKARALLLGEQEVFSGLASDLEPLASDEIERATGR